MGARPGFGRHELRQTRPRECATAGAGFCLLSSPLSAFRCISTASIARVCRCLSCRLTSDATRTPSPRAFIFSVENAVCKDSYRRPCRRNRLLRSLPPLTSVRILTDSVLTDNVLQGGWAARELKPWSLGQHKLALVGVGWRWIRLDWRWVLLGFGRCGGRSAFWGCEGTGRSPSMSLSIAIASRWTWEHA